MHNVITWFDLPTTDFDRAVKFYSDILGTPINVGDHMGQKLGFFPMEEKDGVGGALVPPGMENSPSSQGTRVYLSCEGKLDEMLERVESSGGRIIKPKFHIGEPGWIAIIEDSEGNTVGLHSSK